MTFLYFPAELLSYVVKILVEYFREGLSCMLRNKFTMRTMAIKYSKQPIEWLGIRWISFQYFEAILVCFWHQKFLNLLLLYLVFVTWSCHYLFKNHATPTYSTILQKLKWLSKTVHTNKSSSSYTWNNTLAITLTNCFLGRLYYPTLYMFLFLSILWMHGRPHWLIQYLGLDTSFKLYKFLWFRYLVWIQMASFIEVLVLFLRALLMAVWTHRRWRILVILVFVRVNQVAWGRLDWTLFIALVELLQVFACGSYLLRLLPVLFGSDGAFFFASDSVYLLELRFSRITYVVYVVALVWLVITEFLDFVLVQVWSEEITDVFAAADLPVTLRLILFMRPSWLPTWLPWARRPPLLLSTATFLSHLLNFLGYFRLIPKGLIFRIAAGKRVLGHFEGLWTRIFAGMVEIHVLW